jgi:hypothetical protein
MTHAAQLLTIVRCAAETSLTALASRGTTCLQQSDNDQDLQQCKQTWVSAICAILLFVLGSFVNGRWDRVA